MRKDSGLTPLPGFATPTVLALLCELGPEFSEKFPTAKHFGSWLGLCPDNRITGGKIYSVKTRDVKSRVAEALRLAAQSLWQAKNYFGELYHLPMTISGFPDQPLTRPPATLSPSDGERDGVRGVRMFQPFLFANWYYTGDGRRGWAVPKPSPPWRILERLGKPRKEFD